MIFKNFDILSWLHEDCKIKVLDEIKAKKDIKHWNKLNSLTDDKKESILHILNKSGINEEKDQEYIP